MIGFLPHQNPAGPEPATQSPEPAAFEPAGQADPAANSQEHRAEGAAGEQRQAVAQPHAHEDTLPRTSPFGPIFTGYTNDPEGAIAKLMQEKRGEVADAFIHPELGPIAFVYGNEVMGLHHIEVKRGMDWVNRIPEILRTGRLERDAKVPRAYLVQDSNPAKAAVIRLDWDGEQKTWLVTAHPDDVGKWSGGDKTSRTATEGSGLVQGNPSQSTPQKKDVAAGTTMNTASNDAKGDTTRLDGDIATSVPAPPANGKTGHAQPLDEPVLTPTGWRSIGDLQPGDEIIAADGSTTVVTGVYPQGEQPVFRVELEDGRWTRATADHLWRLFGDGDDVPPVVTAHLRAGVALPVWA